MNEDARELDVCDALGWLRDEFHLTPGVIYLDGNSLGLLSKPAERALLGMLDAWKRSGIGGWLGGEHPWFHFAEELGALSAPLIGAEKDEVLIAGSTSVNLHQMLATLFRPERGKSKILIEEDAFPTDAHVAKSHLKLRGCDPAQHLVAVPSRGGTALDEADIVAAMTDEIAFAILPTALYRTGQLLDVDILSKAARAKGVTLCLDACHSAGAIEHRFHDQGVDCAVFCTYKYLNAGPGAVAGLYVHRKHHGTAPGLAGWFSSAKDRQFDMSSDLEPASTAGAYQIGTPHILSMAPLLGSLELVHRAGIGALRARSLKLTGFLIELAGRELASHDVALATPREEQRRGGHVALRHPQAARLCKALKQRGVIPDFRPPDIVRLSPSPLYTSFAEIAQAIAVLRAILEEKAHLAFSNARDTVA